MAKSASLSSGKEEEQGYILYPGFIDSCFQTVFGFFLKQESSDNVLSIPFGIEKLSYIESLDDPVWLHASIRSKAEGFASIDFTLLNAQGYPTGQVVNFTSRPAPNKSLKDLTFKKKSIGYMKNSWIPKPLEKTERQLANPHGRHSLSLGQTRIHGLQFTTVKPDQAATEVMKNDPAADFLWFAPERNSLKHALTFVKTLGDLAV